MKTEVDFEKMFMFWTQDSKWGGIMNLEWLIIKDVPFKEFREIVILMKYMTVKIGMVKESPFQTQEIHKRFLWLKERK
jgi:hypothetical protein